MKLPAYPRTKPSGVEWLGDVPEHWEVKRLSYLAMLKSGENITSEMIAEGGDYPVYGGNGLRGNYHKFTHRGHHALIGRQGALCGNINYASGEFYASEHALVVSPLKEFAVVWMGELLRAMNLGQYSVTAAQPGIAAEMIRGLRIPVPPLAEQRAIAAFLDRETGRVDRLVAKKRELIERLKEKRTALISRTVTRGLPPAAARAAGLPANPPLKPSGIEWIGQIPKHWELTKMSWVCGSIRDGTHNPPDRADGIHRLLSVRNVQDGKFALLSDDRTMTAEDFAELQGSYTVEEGDIVLAIVGATTGKSAIVGKLENVTVQRSLAILRPNKTAISSSFLHYVIQSPVVQTEIELTVFKYSAQPGIYLEDIGRLLVVRPPLPEQAVIAAYLDEETAKLDALVGKVEEAVERLQEYRTALITAAVTGKIDVRAHFKTTILPP
jgi:type I restriction enzyme S subunit